MTSVLFWSEWGLLGQHDFVATMDRTRFQNIRSSIKVHHQHLCHQLKSTLVNQPRLGKKQLKTHPLHQASFSLLSQLKFHPLQLLKCRYKIQINLHRLD